MKKYIWIGVVAVVVIAGAFVGGMQYGKHGAKAPLAGDMRQFGGQGGPTGAMGRGNQGSMVTGDIISKDATSITVQTRDGSSKIVFLSNTTEISKFVSGAAADLVIGKTITVTGKANSDGSVAAQTIQLRPALPSPTPTPAR